MATSTSTQLLFFLAFPFIVVKLKAPQSKQGPPHTQGQASLSSTLPQNCAMTGYATEGALIAVYLFTEVISNSLTLSALLVKVA